jgi:hypothetical protein
MRGALINTEPRGLYRTVKLPFDGWRLSWLDQLPGYGAAVWGVFAAIEFEFARVGSAVAAV